MTLPNFVVIGAMKAGTVSLGHYLDDHPAPVRVSPRPRDTRSLGMVSFSVGLTPAPRDLPATGSGVERSRAVLPVVVGDVNRDSWGDDLVDAVEHVAGQLDPVGGEIAVEMVHRARSDDRRGYCGMPDDEGGRHLDERDPSFVGERPECVGGLEFEIG